MGDRWLKSRGAALLLAVVGLGPTLVVGEQGNPAAMRPAARTIQGTVQLPDDRAAFRDATLRISLEDTTVKDVKVRYVSELTFFEVSSEDYQTGAIPFVLGAVSPRPQHTYVIRAHIDVDGNKRLSRGDYKSTTGFPVFGQAGADIVVLKMVAIR